MILHLTTLNVTMPMHGERSQAKSTNPQISIDNDWMLFLGQEVVVVFNS